MTRKDGLLLLTEPTNVSEYGRLRVGLPSVRIVLVVGVGAGVLVGLDRRGSWPGRRLVGSPSMMTGESWLSVVVVVWICSRSSSWLPRRLLLLPPDRSRWALVFEPVQLRPRSIMLPTMPAPFHLLILAFLDTDTRSGLAPTPPGPPRKPRCLSRSVSSSRRIWASTSSRYRRASEVIPFEGAGNQMDECVGGGPKSHGWTDRSDVGGGERGACE